MNGGNPNPKQTAFQKFIGLLSWNEDQSKSRQAEMNEKHQASGVDCVCDCDCVRQSGLLLITRPERARTQLVLAARSS
jgi:hypothetical protein